MNEISSTERGYGLSSSTGVKGLAATIAANLTGVHALEIAYFSR